MLLNTFNKSILAPWRPEVLEKCLQKSSLWAPFYNALRRAGGRECQRKLTKIRCLITFVRTCIPERDIWRQQCQQWVRRRISHPAPHPASPPEIVLGLGALVGLCNWLCNWLCNGCAIVFGCRAPFWADRLRSQGPPTWPYGMLKPCWKECFRYFITSYTCFRNGSKNQALEYLYWMLFGHPVGQKVTEMRSKIKLVSIFIECFSAIRLARMLRKCKQRSSLWVPLWNAFRPSGWLEWYRRASRNRAFEHLHWMIFGRLVCNRQQSALTQHLV